MPQFQHEVVVLNGDGPMTDAWRSQGVSVHLLSILVHNQLTFHRELRAKLPATNFEKIIVWTNIRMPVVINALNKYTNAEIFVHIGNPVSSGIKETVLSMFFPANNKVYLRPVSAYVQGSLEKNSYYRRFANKVSLKPIVIPPVNDRESSVNAHQPILNFGMVARLDPIKDHKTVILAFGLLLEEFPKAILHLVGSGPLMEPLAEFARQQGMQGSVIFHGDVADVYAVMRDWDLFLYATTPSEGLGGTVPEALSIGLPVVATDLPMIREWDPEGRYITFSKPADPESMALIVKQLLADSVRRQKIRDEAPTYVRDHYSPEIFSYNYISKE